MVENQELRQMPLSAFETAPYNVRHTSSVHDLAQSIKNQGALEPSLIEQLNHGERRYEIIAGIRSAEAARIAGLEVVPCIVMSKDPGA